MSHDYVALQGTKGDPAIRPGSSMPTSSPTCPNGRQIVVDCGLGVTRGLVDQGMQLKDLSLIFISHLHSDHYPELGPLLHTAWTAGLKTRVDVYGPAGLDIYRDAFLASMEADIGLWIENERRPDLRELGAFHVIAAGKVTTRDGIRVSTIPAEHPPLVECFACAFRTDSKHVVFSGDTAPIAALEEFARGADLLVQEVMLEDALPALTMHIGNGSDKLMAHWLRPHSFAHYAGRTATNAGVRRLALSHLIPSDDPDCVLQDWKDALAGHRVGPLFVGRDDIRIEF